MADTTLETEPDLTRTLTKRDKNGGQSSDEIEDFEDIDKLLEGIDLTKYDSDNDQDYSFSAKKSSNETKCITNIITTPSQNTSIQYKPISMHERSVQTLPISSESAPSEHISEALATDSLQKTEEKHTMYYDVISGKDVSSDVIFGSLEEIQRELGIEDFGEFITKAKAMIAAASIQEPTNQANIDIEADNLDISDSLIFLKLTLAPQSSEINRKVQNISFNPTNQNLLLGTFQHRKKKGDGLSDGLIYLWDLNSSSSKDLSPVSCLEFTNTIKSASFSKYNPHLVVGGSVTGRVVVWDTRSSRRTPISLSTYPSSTTTHSDITFLKLAESHYYNTIYAVSTDNKLFKWKLNMLMSPEELLVQGDYLAHGSVMCADICDTGSSMRCVMGTHSGNLLSAIPTEGEITKPSILTSLGLPITSVCFNEAASELGLHQLFLCTSLDGSLRIWDQNKQAQLYVDNKFRSPLVEAKWSSSIPYIFSSLDVMGNIDIFNITESFVHPLCQYKSKNNFVTSTQWSPDSSHLAVGDDHGLIQILGLDTNSLKFDREALNKFNHLVGQLSDEGSLDIEKPNFSTLSFNFKNLDELLNI